MNARLCAQDQQRTLCAWQGGRDIGYTSRARHDVGQLDRDEAHRDRGQRALAVDADSEPAAVIAVDDADQPAQRADRARDERLYERIQAEEARRRRGGGAEFGDRRDDLPVRLRTSLVESEGGSCPKLELP